MNRKARRKNQAKDIRLPETMAELHHMLTEANNEGAAHALEVLLFVLVDKFGWDTDQLVELMDHMGRQAQAISNCYTTILDIRRVLKEEYQIEV